MRAAVLAALALAACGATEFPFQARGEEQRYTLTSQLVEDFGEPCSLSGPAGGLQVWRYCAGECPPGYAPACVVACFAGCPAWEFHVLGGSILHATGPE